MNLRPGNLRSSRTDKHGVPHRAVFDTGLLFRRRTGGKERYRSGGEVTAQCRRVGTSGLSISPVDLHQGASKNFEGTGSIWSQSKGCHFYGAPVAAEPFSQSQNSVDLFRRRYLSVQLLRQQQALTRFHRMDRARSRVPAEEHLLPASVRIAEVSGLDEAQVAFLICASAKM